MPALSHNCLSLEGNMTMQSDSNESSLKKCPFCGNEIKKSSYRCPICHSSLAELDQREWDSLASPAPSDQPEEKASRESLRDDSFSPSSTALLVALVVVLVIILSYRLFRIREKDTGAHEPLFSDVHQVDNGKVERPPKLEYPAAPQAADAPAPERVPALPDSTKHAGDASAVPAQETRELRIRQVYVEVLEGLRRKRKTETDSVLLKTGARLECRIIEDNKDSLKVEYRGVTTTIGKGRIEQVERKTPEDIERELRETALARATEIVNHELTPETKPVPLPEEDTHETAAETDSTTSGPAGQIIFTEKSNIPFTSLTPRDPRLTRSFLKSKLGDPDLEYGRTLDYNWKYGFELVISETENILDEIRINSDRFTGWLPSGISFSSSPDAVFQRYGNPIAEERAEDLLSDAECSKDGVRYYNGNFSRIAYRKAGLMFLFFKDRIVQIRLGAES